MEREQISVTIITYNEEENIRACMESITWADEIIVVDSGSNDETVHRFETPRTRCVMRDA